MIKQFISTLALSIGLSAAAHAVPVTLNMTADNIIAGGGLCTNSTCTAQQSWNALGASNSNFNNWQRSSTLALNLDAGTHHFAWHVVNQGQGSSGNPAGLLAEILWTGGAHYSSSMWEIFNPTTGSLIQYATQYGANGGNNIWTNNNGGAVSGISNNANWIYTSSNFNANMPNNAWIRTSITIASVPEPATMAIMGIGLAMLGFARRKQAQTQKAKA